MSAPFVGLPSTITDGTCAYAADIDTENCSCLATTHIIGLSAAWGWVALDSCDAHVALAKAGLLTIADVHDVADCDGEHYQPLDEIGGAR